ncbi:MAG: ribose 5-phosphate isomerase B [Eubacteriaceae bacterium]|jgi:ribose 5-phosphate isomerase B|uniref:Ribose 5-phosphate isomerase B n=1 Tax=Candidatus Pseudoramibacter fermentans TaxID=2594427 RepID=A0A6L5GTR1_9FIRM|nr:ribose 5-phosphate isomerase B [Candidatus Pseudoramibacter fermentans]RRF93426.1 MAG: ribose 5-phosphate isomerase B [Eubacteriaceae bacterium]
MKIAIGSDHGGYELKQKFIEELKNQYQVEVIDCGCDSTDSVDYPDYGRKVGETVVSGQADRGIVICGTGIGISISANKVPGVRAALCTNEYMAMMTRKHNNANVLALGARVVGDELAKDILRVWLTTEFEGGRHQRRLDKISAIEEKYSRS